MRTPHGSNKRVAGPGPRFGLVAMAFTLLLAGCGGGKKITELQRKEASHLVSEADFAMTLRDYARAEGTLAKAVELCPDTGSYWMNLGLARIRQGNRSGGKNAYQSALHAFEAAAGVNKTEAYPWLKQVYVLALLGRAEDSRALLAKAAKQFPANRAVKNFIEQKQLDLMLADPSFKQDAL